MKWNLSQGPMLAFRERSTQPLTVQRATLIVILYGVSLILRSLSWLPVSFIECYDKYMLEKVLAVSTLCAAVLLLAFLQVTSPSTVHPLGILFVFILIYVLALGLLTLFIFCGSKLLVVFHLTKNALTTRSAYLYATVVALVPVMIVCMRSIGRIGFYEVLLVIAFETVACFYIAKHR